MYVYKLSATRFSVPEAENEYYDINIEHGLKYIYVTNSLGKLLTMLFVICVCVKCIYKPIKELTNVTPTIRPV